MYKEIKDQKNERIRDYQNDQVELKKSNIEK